MLWDCLFLTTSEIQELLDYVRVHAHLPWIYPMFCFAAHTGAMRSEMLRALVSDVDLEGGMVLVREKKRVKGVRSTRRVPLTAPLRQTPAGYLEDHPGTTNLFNQPPNVAYSRQKSQTHTPVSVNQVRDHFVRVLAGSKWSVIRGWHCLRHSFISSCVAQGIDQRVLDKWVGHTSDIRDRYIHLVPSNEQQAIQGVFE